MKAYSLDLRQKIVEAYQNCEGSQRQLAKRFKVSPRFVQKLLHQYHHEGTIAPRTGAKGFPKKLSAYESEVREIVAENADDTLAELTEKLRQRLGLEFSLSTLHYHLKRLKLTGKKTLHAEQAETDRVQELRVESWHQVGGINPSDLVFIDEISISLEGTTNGTAFQVFVKEVLVKCLWPGAVVIMDNLSAHKAAMSESLLAKAGARLIYLPPYSPDFNPIENCWSKLKQYLRSVTARCRDTIETALVNAIDLVTLEQLENWFIHCCYCSTPS